VWGDEKKQQQATVVKSWQEKTKKPACLDIETGMRSCGLTLEQKTTKT